MSTTINDIHAEADDLGEAIRDGRPLRGARFHFLFALDGTTFRRIELDDPIPTGRQILHAAGERSVDDLALFLITADGDFEDVRPDEEIDLLGRRGHRFVAFSGDPLYRFLLNDMHIVWGAPTISEEVLRTLAGIGPDEDVFLEVRGGTDHPIARGGVANLAGAGVERFITAHDSRTYRLFVNGRPYETQIRTPSGAQIKALVGNWDPTSDLALEGEGSEPDRIIGDDETVDLDPASGTRRFSSVPKATFG